MMNNFCYCTESVRIAIFLFVVKHIVIYYKRGQTPLLVTCMMTSLELSYPKYYSELIIDTIIKFVHRYFMDRNLTCCQLILILNLYSF